MKKITIIIPAEEKTVITALKSINDEKIQVIIENGKNPSENRNKGIKKAKTEFVAFINAHTLLDKTWVNEVIKFFKKYPKIDIVGGPQLNYSDEKFFPRVSGYALSSVFGAAGVSNRYKKSRLNLNADETLLTSANLICRSKVLKKIKFDETIYPGEDSKFIEEVKKAGFKVAYSPDIIVYNLRRKNIFALSKQIFHYGATRPQKESFRSTLKKPFFIIPSVFLIYVLAILTTALFERLNIIILIPLILYFLMDIWFSLIQSIINREIIAFLILIVIYPLIHFSYGIGFLASTIKNFKYND